MKKLKDLVVQNVDKPVAAEILAEEILRISKAMKQISESRLTRRAIVALIHDQSKLGKYQIELVLNNLESLEETWLKKKGKP